MLRNAEQGVYGLQGEAKVSGLREEAQKAELTASLRELEEYHTIVTTFMDEMVVVREEQASANHTSELLAAELKPERMYSRAALGTSGNRGDPQESGGAKTEGSEHSRHLQDMVQRFEEFSLEVHAKFEGIRLDLERTRDTPRELAQSLWGFQGDLQELAETVDSLRGGVPEPVWKLVKAMASRM